MKKSIAIVLAALLLAVGIVTFSACQKDGGSETGDGVQADVYMPDGAPALALAQLMADEMQFGANVTYNIVDSTAITTYVTGNETKAELCILPVNLAAKTLGSGEVYRMLGTVTHGNIYFLSAKYEETLTVETLNTLIGKTVGCIQLNNVVGLTLQLVLKQNDIAYTVVEDVSQKVADKVNLIGINNPASEILPTAEFDYMVAAEPVVTAKTSATPLKLVGDLQALYGEGGYPQAVLVAKAAFIEENAEFIEDFTAAVSENAAWILKKDTSASTIYTALAAHLPDGKTPTFKEANLTKTVLANCAIRFESAKNCKEEVNTFLEKLGEVAGQSFAVSDSFYYVG